MASQAHVHGMTIEKRESVNVISHILSVKQYRIVKLYHDMVFAGQ